MSKPMTDERLEILYEFFGMWRMRPTFPLQETTDKAIELADEVTRLRKREAELMAAMRRIEWMKGGEFYDYCECDGEHGHMTNCVIGNALKGGGE